MWKKLRNSIQFSGQTRLYTCDFRLTLSLPVRTNALYCLLSHTEGILSQSRPGISVIFSNKEGNKFWMKRCEGRIIIPGIIEWIGGCPPSYIQIDVHIGYSCWVINTVFGFSCLAKSNNSRIYLKNSTLSCWANCCTNSTPASITQLLHSR